MGALTSVEEQIGGSLEDQLSLNARHQGLIEVHLKVNMSIHLLEINDRVLKRPARFLDQAARPWRLFARCTDESQESCVLLQQLLGLAQQSTKDGKAALAALDKLIQIAAKGMPLEHFYDKKQSHELYSFEYKGKRRVVWRLRKGDVRVAFYYAEDKVIFLADAFAKRRDKLTLAEEARIREEVCMYIDAENEGLLHVLC